MRRATLRTLAITAVFVASLSAQQIPGSTIFGHVICSDTNSPARFAKVLLKSVAPSHAVEDRLNFEQTRRQQDAAANGQSPKPLTDDEKRSTTAEARMDALDWDMQNSAATALDGAFSFAGVKPGTYYVHVVFAGYIDPFSQLSGSDFTSTDPAIRALVAKVPTITVSGTDSARVDIRLERGAAVTGRLLFDDGSSAAGWTVAAVRAASNEEGSDVQTVFLTQILSFGWGVPIVKTDDLGRFRLPGLSAGDYTLRATLLVAASGHPMGSMADNGLVLTVYSGDTFSHAKAKPIHLLAGEDRNGADINIPTRELHTIAGKVVAKSDEHAVNAGQVTLTAKDDPSIRLAERIQKDGSFRFQYLPGGVTYTLEVTAADIQMTPVPPEKNPREGAPMQGPTVFVGDENSQEEEVHRYGRATTTVALQDTDTDSLRISVPDPPNASAQ